MEEAHLTP
jgi:putative transposase